MRLSCSGRSIAGMNSPNFLCAVRRPSSGDSPLRIAVVTETYRPEINGVAMTMGKMVDGLLAQGHRVQLVRTRQHPSDHPAQHGGLEETLVRGMAIPRYSELKLGLPAPRRLAQLWRAERPDVVHLTTEGPLGWSALRVARGLGLPVTSDFHTNFHHYSRHYGVGGLDRVIQAYLRWFHNATHATFVPTRELRDALTHQGYRSVQVVSRGVDTTLFSPTRHCAALREFWGAAPDDLVVIHVGRLAPEKNLPLVLRSFQAIRASVPKARLVLVGDGPARAALQREHPGHVFAGMRTGEDLAAHYASADLFLFPSLTETFGNVTTEAMASGLAVVAFDYAAAAELIAHGKTGFLAPCGDEQAFITAARSAVDDPARLDAVRAAARAAVTSRDWSRVSEDFADALARTIQAQQPPGATHATFSASN